MALPNPANPCVQPLAPGLEMVIDRAVTAPVELADPMAMAHLPTAKSVADADVRWVNVVADASVTTTLEDTLVEGLVSLTVTFEPLTEVTEPDATPN